jgi:DNA (cytosine-5)-methyltransferase 1
MDVNNLRIPDRFERLRDLGDETLTSIIVPVEPMLEELDERFMDMRAADRGSLMILRGTSGAGKSTFLDTVGFFRQHVSTRRIPRDANVAQALRESVDADNTIVVFEGREALGDVSGSEIESAMHEINQFVRSEEGRRSLVVWPTNRDDLTDLLVGIGESLGREALFGISDPVTFFGGPPKTEFARIAQQTVSVLNEGASLDALGISIDLANDLAEKSDTIGNYLARIRMAAVRAGARVERLLTKERYRMWTLTVSGNDVEGDVAALTRGGFSAADVDRLLSSTGANVVSDLKKHPEKTGILGTVLDARIVNMDMVCMLAVTRTYGSPELHKVMQSKDMITARDSSAARRLLESDLGILLQDNPLGTRKRGPKPGSNTKDAFAKLVEISRTNDGLLNDALGRGLVETGLIDSYETERNLGTDLVFNSDLYCVKNGAPIRLELMWRARTGRATIANYVLGKINNYGKAIGVIQ